LGCGRLVASSPVTRMRDGAEPSLKGSRSRPRVRSDASKSKLPLTPATKELAGSKPSGGRLNVVFCDCEIAVTFTCPFVIGNSAAMPKMDVGAAANSGFSSYCTCTWRACANSVSGRVKVTRPSS
jgi:hypothetical protein